MSESRDRSESTMAQGADGIPVSFGDPSDLTEADILTHKQDSQTNGNLANAYLTHTNVVP